MVKEHVTYSYTFDELEPAAQEKAVEAVAEKLSGAWWDENDNETVAESISYTFGTEVGEPGDTGTIDGVKLAAWSCAYAQGDHVGFAGHLTRQNAPKLPWADGIDSVTLEVTNYGHTQKWFVMDDAECICDGFSSIVEPTCEAHEPNPASEAEIQALRDAIESALSAALQAGYRQIEFVGSAENAREWIDSNEPQFNADGTLF